MEFGYIPKRARILSLEAGSSISGLTKKEYRKLNIMIYQRKKKKKVKKPFRSISISIKKKLIIIINNK